ncbi:CoA transferase [Diaphorobacter aerolatus]|uniref:CoA transferase n=2 Tax=Diaphorobacter aerolatus TaxID=1288495 RepID=A0A7H0GQH2_9BURK|nr:CoA transferase [Diaphorobacter aerolatus]
MPSTPTILPLQGIRVLELCNVAAGPFCGMLLADMGADLIKVENPTGGDTLRTWPPITEGFSENFASLNRNKRSVTLDLKSPGDVARLRELVASADVLIENNRPGVMKRLGLDYDALKAVNGRLLYCSISAYGQTGPRASEGGFDLTIQAMSGIMSVTGEADGAPVKCGVPLSDFAAGLYAAYTIAASLRHVQQSGEGAHIDVPMLGTSLAIAALQTSEYFGSGRDPGKLGSAHPRNAPYQAFRCSDGHFAMAAGNNALWRSVTEVVGLPELLDDERFTSPTLRAKNQVALRDLLEMTFMQRDGAHWLAEFARAGVPSAPINSYSQVLEDPQVEHMDWVQEITLPGHNVTKTFVSPVKINGQGQPVRMNPPALGEHNGEVFADGQEVTAK